MSLLAKQLEAFRLEKRIPETRAKKRAPAPSVLFSPEEAKQLDAEAISALALRGIAGVAALDPDLAVYGKLFEGPAPEREMLTKDENRRFDSDIRKFLLLLSPHLPIRAAQECLDGLLSRFAVHEWNVDDVLACALPYHDSPLFTRILEGLHIEGKPKWSWLKKFKDGPITLVRSALAKYCGKDLAVLTYIGSVVQETAKLQKSNRALASFYAALWLDAVSFVPSVSSDLVEAAMPTLLLVLRKPHLRDSFHACLAVAGALCVQADLSPEARLQLVDRVARQIGAPGAEGRAALGFLALHAQLQELEEVLSGPVVRSLASAGSEALSTAIPTNVDCGNLLGAVMRASVVALASGNTAGQKDDDEDEGQPMDEELAGFVAGLLQEEALTQCYAAPLAKAALCAFCEVSDDGKTLVADALTEPLAELGDTHPLVVSKAFKEVVDASLEAGLDAEPLVQLMAPSCAPVATNGDRSRKAGSGSFVPMIQAFSHKTSQVRCEALTNAVVDLETSDGRKDAQRQQLLVSLALQSAQDDDPDVACQALKNKVLWASLPQAKPHMTVPTLESVLAQHLSGTSAQGATLQALFVNAFLQGTRASIVSAAIECCSWVYERTDCSPELRHRIDLMLIPAVLLAAVGLDLSSQGEKKKKKKGGVEKNTDSAQRDLRAAVLAFCNVSEHALFTSFTGADLPKPSAANEGSGLQLGPLSTAMVQALSAETAPSLCSIVECKAWAPRTDESVSLLCGGASALAAIPVLSAAVLGLLESIASSSVEKAEAFLLRCAEACKQFISCQSSALEEAAKEPVCQLLRTLLQGAATLDTRRRQAAPASGGKRRRSRSNVGAVASLGCSSLHTAVVSVLRSILDRPKVMAGELRLALGTHREMLRPAILQIALRPLHQNSPAATANALLVLRSLIGSAAATSWGADQCLIVPLVVRLASADASEVRTGLLEVLAALQAADWSTSQPDWDSTCAAALRDAGILRSQTDVIAQSGWDAASQQGLDLAGLPQKTRDAFLEVVLANKAEIVRDKAAIAATLSKFLSGKSVAKSARASASAFWVTGLAMLASPLCDDCAELLRAVPTTVALSSLIEPVRKSADDVIAKLKDGKVEGLEAPVIIKTVSNMALDVLQGLAGLKENAEASAAECIESFVRSIALPICAAVSSAYEGGYEVKSDSVVELLDSICKVVVCVASDGSEVATTATVAKALDSEATASMLKLCAATSPSGANAEAADDEQETETVVSALPPSRRAPAVVRGAFAEAQLSATRLRELLESPDFKGKKANSFAARVKISFLQPHIVALKTTAMTGAGELLLTLAKLIKTATSWQEDECKADFLRDAMASLAALSEHIVAPGAMEERSAVDGQAVCNALSEVCATFGDSLTAGMFSATLRTCNALAPFVPALPSVKAAARGDGDVPAPLQTCLRALSCFSQPLNIESIGLLKAGLSKLPRFPEPTHVNGDSEGAAAMRRDLLTQSRLRPLLQCIMLDRPKLVEDLGVDLCLSLAHSAGASQSLDFTLLLLLARRLQDRASPVKRKKKKQKKRQAAAEDDALADELQAAPEQDHDADDALKLLTSVNMEQRFHCLGTLMQTICGLASAIRQHKRTGDSGLDALWGPALLPGGLVELLGVDRSLTLLETALTVVSRFIVEHGIPNGLDDEDVDTAVYRSLATSAERTEGANAAALALCYVVKGACMVEVVVSKIGGGGPAKGGCLDAAKHLRALIMRSLAVNHPATFFRSLCFTLNLEKSSPPMTLLRESAKSKEMFLSEAFCALAAAREALEERRALHGEAGNDDVDADEELHARCTPLCEAAMRHVCKELLHSQAADNSQEIAWQFLESLSLFSAKFSPKPVLALCVPAVATCLREATTPNKSASASFHKAAVASCVCLQTVVEQLGRGIMEKLNLVSNVLLEVVAPAGDADENSGSALLQTSALRTLKALLKHVGAFMSPFLDRLLKVMLSVAPQWRTALLEELGREVVSGVPHRLLLPAVQSASASAVKKMQDLQAIEDVSSALDTVLVEMQRASTFQLWIYAESPPDFVAANADAAAASLLQLLSGGAASACSFLRLGGQPEAVSLKIFKRRLGTTLDVAGGAAWVDNCSEGDALRLNALNAQAFAQFALRLSFEDLKPRFAKVVEWARNMQTQTLARQGSRKAATDLVAEAPRDAEDACRALALMSMMRALGEEAPDVSEELLLPLATKDVAACLTAARRQAVNLVKAGNPGAKKRRRIGLGVSRSRSVDVLPSSTWWWFEVFTQVFGFVAQALKQAGAGAGQTKASEEALDELAEPCTDALDMFEYLPSAEGEDPSPLAADFFQSLQAALVALVAASDGARVKRLLTGILGKSRSEDAEVRLCSVQVCHKIWLDLGVQAVSGLSEVIMFASELLEDEDPRVETAVRALIKTIEECTGESLQDQLKA